ncbi:hypothetical protein [Sporolactobacillus spathodeae]|uniref:Uncharacterized protein n=1 Tax=Sporolactobacillus spathodeae TaxID=1465502 RepID=A0ABS2Q9U4_9BACL|nr:hypothetical protein [Sporolactobacillus spathodeae]MBM7658215.1 hypothetical protein [Sporolactobacillus spathodeae]
MSEETHGSPAASEQPEHIRCKQDLNISRVRSDIDRVVISYH